MQLMPKPMQALGILICFVEADALSKVMIVAVGERLGHQVVVT